MRSKESQKSREEYFHREWSVLSAALPEGKVPVTKSNRKVFQILAGTAWRRMVDTEARL